jgi:hypothetical protein
VRLREGLAAKEMLARGLNRREFRRACIGRMIAFRGAIGIAPPLGTFKGDEAVLTDAHHSPSPCIARAAMDWKRASVLIGVGM